ncbi:MAG: universal stress protein [Planctomycetota bacterium]
MQRVVLATDDSESALRAARLLGRLFDVSTLEITLVSVVNWETPSASLDSTCEIARLVDQSRANAMTALEHVRFTLGLPKEALQHVIGDGHVGEFITTTARELTADLIVVGDRRHSSVGRVLLGSTSDYVATHASCSVLVVRNDVADRMPGSLRMCVPVDPEAAPEQIRTMVDWFSMTDAAHIDVASVLVPPMAQSPEVPSYWAHDEQAAQKTLDQVRRDCESHGIEAADHLINAASVSNGLIKHFSECAIDLALMNETNRTPIGRFLLGSVSRSVLRYAKCSVLIRRRTEQDEPNANKAFAVPHDERDGAMT